jgi:hypothetical protein
MPIAVPRQTTPIDMIFQPKLNMPIGIPSMPSNVVYGHGTPKFLAQI